MLTLFNFTLVFKILQLSLQNHSNCHFYFEYAQRMLYAYSNLLSAPSNLLNAHSNLLSAHSKYFVSNIRANPFFLCLIQGDVNLFGQFLVWRIFLLLQQQHGGAKCCSMCIQNVSGDAQCSFKIWRELLCFITYATKPK